MDRPVLDVPDIHPAIRERIAHYQEDLLTEVQSAIADNDVVVVGMAQNPFVKKARAMLQSRRVPFTYLEYGSYLSLWRRRLALKMWTGWPTFPMIFVKGAFVGGWADLERLIESGEFDAMLG